jgi:hypothetical protein
MYGGTPDDSALAADRHHEAEREHAWPGRDDRLPPDRSGNPQGPAEPPIVVNGIVYDDGKRLRLRDRRRERQRPLGMEADNTGVFADYGVNANRGVAYCDGKVFLLTLDMKIVSLDASSGKLVKALRSRCGPGASAEFNYWRPRRRIAEPPGLSARRDPLRRPRFRDGVHDRAQRGRSSPY